MNCECIYLLSPRFRVDALQKASGSLFFGWFQEQYVPTRHGRLPMSVYRRNGMQDQVYGYRGAQIHLCTGQGLTGPCVCMNIQPLRRINPKITSEMWPVRRKRDKKGF